MVQVINTLEGFAQDDETPGFRNLRERWEFGCLDVVEKEEFLRVEFIGEEKLIDKAINYSK